MTEHAAWIIPGPSMEAEARHALLERLKAHRLLGSAPVEELEWLIDHGELRHYEVGSSPYTRDETVDRMGVVLSGRMVFYVDRGSGRHKVLEWNGGDVSGLLPYSRLKYAPGDPIIEETAEFLEVHKTHLPELIQKCPIVTERCVHVMLDRARHFNADHLQDEKMMSLGRVAAGLAHELNNPAAAAARSAKMLLEALDKADEASHALGEARLGEAERELLARLRGGSLATTRTGVFSVLERADREDEIADWLDEHDADLDAANSLVESGLSTSDLDLLAESIPAETLPAAINWVAAGYMSRTLARDVERATTRIYELVTAVKRHSFMDKASVPELGDLAPGLTDTVTILAAKARSKGVAVRVQLPQTLPRVRMYGGELNQVWFNLIDNAIDVAPAGSEVIIDAVAEVQNVNVRITDSGAGIPPEVMKHIWDPFFTTKDPGQGTGLGLDIARRIVRKHNGDIEVNSRPGRTQFCVLLPLP